MDHFSGVEQQNDGFRKVAFVSMAVFACVLAVYVLQTFGLIPWRPF